MAFSLNLESTSIWLHLAYLGFLFGLIHVFTGADHLSTLATLSVSTPWKYGFGLGIRWGLGHSLGIAVVTAILMSLGLNLEFLTEIAGYSIGAFLIIIGSYGLYRSRKIYNHALKQGVDLLSASLSGRPVGHPPPPPPRELLEEEEEEEEGGAAAGRGGPEKGLRRGLRGADELARTHNPFGRNSELEASLAAAAAAPPPPPPSGEAATAAAAGGGAPRRASGAGAPPKAGLRPRAGTTPSVGSSAQDLQALFGLQHPEAKEDLRQRLRKAQSMTAIEVGTRTGPVEGLWADYGIPNYISKRLERTLTTRLVARERTATFDTLLHRSLLFQRAVAFGIGVVHGVAGPGGLLGVLPALEQNSWTKAFYYLFFFTLSSTLAMGLFASTYGGITHKLGGESVKWTFYISSSSYIISITVGIVWISLLPSGALEDL